MLLLCIFAMRTGFYSMQMVRSRVSFDSNMPPGHEEVCCQPWKSTCFYSLVLSCSTATYSPSFPHLWQLCLKCCATSGASSASAQIGEGRQQWHRRTSASVSAKRFSQSLGLQLHLAALAALPVMIDSVLPAENRLTRSHRQPTPKPPPCPPPRALSLSRRRSLRPSACKSWSG